MIFGSYSTIIIISEVTDRITDYCKSCISQNTTRALKCFQFLIFSVARCSVSVSRGQCEVCRHFFEDTFEDTFGDTFEDTFNDFSRLYMVLITFGDTFNSFCRHFYV